jgi:hypothetical protein
LDQRDQISRLPSTGLVVLALGMVRFPPRS